jgi:hypothetical protein
MSFTPYHFNPAEQPSVHILQKFGWAPGHIWTGLNPFTQSVIQ